MTRNIQDRLSRMGSRRAGLDRVHLLNESSKQEIIKKSTTNQAWQNRAKDRPHTRYVLGAMQPVDDQYTAVSVETAKRVGNQLQTALLSNGIGCDFRLQGSVPLNIHIRGVSDVDLLVLNTDFLTYRMFGDKALAGDYIPSNQNSFSILSQLRTIAEETLTSKFPAAKVDRSGSKSIKISGGSLARPVDVVPSHWDDTIDFQKYGLEYFRGVKILNKKTLQTIDNLPFLHIKKSLIDAIHLADR